MLQTIAFTYAWFWAYPGYDDGALATWDGYPQNRVTITPTDSFDGFEMTVPGALELDARRSGYRTIFFWKHAHHSWRLVLVVYKSRVLTCNFGGIGVGKPEMVELLGIHRRENIFESLRGHFFWITTNHTSQTISQLRMLRSVCTFLVSSNPFQYLSVSLPIYVLQPQNPHQPHWPHWPQ